jgi:hypothetical protein
MFISGKISDISSAPFNVQMKLYEKYSYYESLNTQAVMRVFPFYLPLQT